MIRGIRASGVSAIIEIHWSYQSVRYASVRVRVRLRTQKLLGVARPRQTLIQVHLVGLDYDV